MPARDDRLLFTRETSLNLTSVSFPPTPWIFKSILKREPGIEAAYLSFPDCQSVSDRKATNKPGMLFKATAWAILLAQLHISLVLAGVSFTNNDYYVYAGTPFTITWTDNRGAVTITLMKGPDVNLEPVLVVVADYEGQEYVWTPPATLPAESYLFKVEDAGSVDYSSRFRYPAPLASGATSTTASDSTATSTTTITATAAPSATSPSDATPQPLLSTAAIAIIAALGSLLLLALLAMGCYCFVRRRRRRRQQQRESQHHHNELPLSAVDSFTLRSPDATTAGAGSGHIKPASVMDREGVYGYPGFAGYGSTGTGVGVGAARAELPSRGWGDESVELSSDAGRQYK